MNLAGGGPNFASFAKSGDKIANLATLAELNCNSVKVVPKKNLNETAVASVA